MDFDHLAYGPQAAAVLELGERGSRPMPLAIQGCTSEEARALLATAKASEWFPGARAPEAALSGLWLYFGCFEESHGISQDLSSPEGSYWHAILHRQEPDAGNAGYWFRRVGRHPVFEPLLEAAQGLAAAVPSGFRVRDRWDPFEFVDFCESARQKPGSSCERLACAIQLAEWQLLFDYCAQPRLRS